MQRMQTAMTDIARNHACRRRKPIRPLDAREGRRLAETVRELSAERDTLKTRVAALEQGLGRRHRLNRPGREGRQPARRLPPPLPEPPSPASG